MTYTAYRIVLKARPHRPMGDAQRDPHSPSDPTGSRRGRHAQGPTIGDPTDADLHDGQPFDAEEGTR